MRILLVDSNQARREALTVQLTELDARFFDHSPRAGGFLAGRG